MSADDNEYLHALNMLYPENATFLPEITSSTTGVNISTGADIHFDTTEVARISDSINTDGSGNATTAILLNMSTHAIANLQNHVTQSSTSGSSSVIPDVIIRQEVRSDGGFETAEKVLIGTALTIGCLTFLSIILRILVPLLRSKTLKSDGSDVKELKAGFEQAERKLSGYTNLGIEEISFHLGGNGSSHSSGSTPSTDWTDVSVEKSQAPEVTESVDANTTAKHNWHRLLVTDQPSRSDHGLSRSDTAPSLTPKQSEEAISVISSHSSNPLAADQAYRNHWKDPWETGGHVTGINLSHCSQPSDSCLSLTSHSSHTSGSASRNSSTVPSGSYAVASSGFPDVSVVAHGGQKEFPIPSKAMVQQLHLETDRRYPSSTKPAPALRTEATTCSPPSRIR